MTVIYRAHPKTNVILKTIKFSELFSLSEAQVMIANSRSKEEILSFWIGSFNIGGSAYKIEVRGYDDLSTPDTIVGWIHVDTEIS